MLRYVASVAVLLSCIFFFADDLIKQGHSFVEKNSFDQKLDRIIEQYGRAGLLLPDDITPEVNPALNRLGKELFFSKSLSGNMDVACVSCHHPLLAGGDKLSLPVGESPYEPDLLGPGRWHDWRESSDPKADGAPNVPRHSPTTFNTTLYNRTMFHDGRLFVLDENKSANGAGQRHRSPDSNLWQADPKAGKNLLATQARFPVVSPHEMQGFGFNNSGTHEDVRDALVQRLRGVTGELKMNNWLQLFREAYQAPQGTAEELITFENIQNALADYQASQLFIDNDWYAYVKGDKGRLNEQQKQGALLFFNTPERGGAGCVNCHAPPIFSDEKFHNIAIPQFGRGMQANGEDFGRRGVTQKDKDRFDFRTPSLLNVAKSFPYGHTGAFLDLRSVIQHHVAPKKSIEQFDFSFSNNGQLKYVASLYKKSKTHTDAALQDLLDKQQSGKSLLSADLNLDDDDISALEAFLNTLTDPCLNNTQCLSKLIPDESESAPDNNRLVARFSEHTAPPATLNLDKSLTNKRVGDDGNTNAVTTDLMPRLSNECSHGMPGINNGGFVFDEIAIQSGLLARHRLSWDLYKQDTAQRVLFSGGVAAGDVDGDCWADIYYPTGDNTVDVLYKNNKDGTFSDISKAWGINKKEFSNGVAMADIDGDGDLDIIVSNIIHPSMPSIIGSVLGEPYAQFPTIYKNEDQERFSLWTDLKIKANFTSWSFAFADYDADGDLDVLSTHWRGPGLGGEQPNHLWKNNGADQNIAFSAEDKSANLLGLVGKSDFTFTGIMSDFNMDGYPDILMASDFENSQIYVNKGNGSFDKVTEQSQINDKNGMGAAVADYDNDGDLDWFVSSVWDPNGVAEGTWGTIGNRLYNNNGGIFTDVTEAAGVAEGYWGWGACFADFNNDGWPDLFHVNGFDMDHSMARHIGGPRVFMKLKRSMSEFEETPSRLFISNQDGTFSERSKEWGITDKKSGRGVVCFDYDRDGDVDILVSNHQDRLLLYKNNARSNENTNFINITLKGLGKNTKAVGAKVYVTANGITQLQEMRAGGSFLSSSPYELHFGLGSAQKIDKIEIVWPRPHYYSSVLNDLEINQFVTIEQTHKN